MQIKEVDVYRAEFCQVGCAGSYTRITPRQPPFFNSRNRQVARSKSRESSVVIGAIPVLISRSGFQAIPCRGRLLVRVSAPLI